MMKVHLSSFHYWNVRVWLLYSNTLILRSCIVRFPLKTRILSCNANINISLLYSVFLSPLILGFFPCRLQEGFLMKYSFSSNIKKKTFVILQWILNDSVAVELKLLVRILNRIFYDSPHSFVIVVLYRVVVRKLCRYMNP